MKYGFVYLLSNPCMEGIFKVGCSERSPHARVDELSYSTSVPLPFQVVCYIEAENCQWLEGQMHRWLGAFRLNDRREFFKLDEWQHPWLLGLFKFNPWALTYAECDLSGFFSHGFEDQNPWHYDPETPAPAFHRHIQGAADGTH